MKARLFITTILMPFMLISNISCGQWGGIKGNGNVVTQQRNISSFSELDVSGSFEIILSQGEEYALTVEADENLMEVIKTEVNGDELNIYTEKDIRGYKAMKVFITFRDLESIDVSGAVEVKSNNAFYLKELEIDGSGATELYLVLEADYLDLDFSGAGEAYIEGSVDKVDLNASGASEIDALQLKVRSFSIETSGASKVSAWVTEVLDVESSGASNISYKGSPDVVNTDISGAGSIRKISSRE